MNNNRTFAGRTWPLSLFSRCHRNQANNSGNFIYLDSLFLVKGSMSQQKYPKDEDCLLLLLEDGEGQKIQFNCYGATITQFAAIHRGTIVRITDFVIGTRKIAPIYQDASPTHYGYIEDRGTAQPRLPRDVGVNTLMEVKSHQSQFSLKLLGMEEIIYNDSVKSYKNSHWRTEDGQHVLITAYREYIQRLQGFGLQPNKVYTIVNALPYSGSRFSPNNFTIGPATMIDETGN